jgi:hypothetical protein
MSAADSWMVRFNSRSMSRQAVAVGVVQLHVEGLEPAQHREPMRPAATVPTCMPSRSYERATQSAMFQPPFDHPLVGGDVVAHQPRIIITTCSATLMLLQ